MEKQFAKGEEGEVVVTKNLEPVVLVFDLAEMKSKAVELERCIAERRALFVEQTRVENERASQALIEAGKATDAQITAWQTELDELTENITGAEAIGVEEVIPVPVEEVIATPDEVVTP